MTCATYSSITHKSPPPVSPKEESSKLTALVVPSPIVAPVSTNGRQTRKRSSIDRSPSTSTIAPAHSVPSTSKKSRRIRTASSQSSTKVTDQRRSVSLSRQPQLKNNSQTHSSAAPQRTNTPITSHGHTRDGNSSSSEYPSSEGASGDPPSAHDQTPRGSLPVIKGENHTEQQMGNCIRFQGQRDNANNSPRNHPQKKNIQPNQSASPLDSDSSTHNKNNEGDPKGNVSPDGGDTVKDLSSGDDREHHQLEQRSRRRLSLIHADPITHQSIEGPRGTTQVVTPGDASRREKLTLHSLFAQVNPEGRRLSVMGAATHRLQGNFENKDETCRGNVAGDSLQTMGIGHACKKGLKPESPNQDDFFIYRVDDIGLYGVFDGHGPYGHDISNYVQSNLCQYIWNHDSFDVDKIQALRAAFAKTQADIEAMCERHEFDASLSGCTATVIIHDVLENKLFVAHLGDSRAVLGRRGGTAGTSIDAVDLTEDHKPTLENEKARIEAHGGEVKRLEGDIPHRVFLKDKLYPGLAMSRAFGDLVATQAGVTSEPEIRVFDIDPKVDLFVLLCSDGVWEFISSQEAVQMIARHNKEAVQAAADQLARESWNKWIVEEGDVVDDITVEIIYL